MQALFITQTRDNIALEIANLLQGATDNKTLLLVDQQTLNNASLEKLLQGTYQKYQLPTKTRPIISIKHQDIVKPIFGDNGELPETFINNLFKLSLNKASIPQKIDTANYSFAVIKSIINAKNRDSQIYKQMTNISEMNYKNEIYDQYLDYLRNKYPIEINISIINHKSYE